MALMSKSGVNPLSGCLPLLPQIPVFLHWILFKIHSIYANHPSFLDKRFNATRSLLHIASAYGCFDAWLSKMIPMPSMDPTQAKMMKILPLVFSIFMVFIHQAWLFMLLRIRSFP